VAEVMIRCPVTGDAVPTGFSAVSQVKFRHMVLEPLLVKCQACRQLHEWSRKDAFLG
jgi:hypothetical protein